MRTKRFAYVTSILFVAILIFMLYYYTKIYKKMDTLVQDYSFVLIKRSSLSEYEKIKSDIDNGNFENVLSELDSMARALNTPLVNESIESKIYYERFIESVEGIAYLKEAKKDGENFIEEFRNKVSIGAIKKTDIDRYLLFYFHFKCNFFFSKIWYLQPCILFTENFYEFYKSTSANPQFAESGATTFSRLVNFEIDLAFFDRGISFEKSNNEFYSGFYVVDANTIEDLLSEYMTPIDEDKYQYQLYYQMLNNSKNGDAMLLIKM